MSYLGAIRSYCLGCCNASSLEVSACEIADCSLHPYRSGHCPPGSGSRLRAIRSNCLECADSSSVVAACPFKECSLYPYRKGHNPALAGRGCKGTPFLRTPLNTRLDGAISPQKGRDQ